LDDIVLERFGISAPTTDLSGWVEVVEAKFKTNAEVHIAMVGKYVATRDAYISLNEALMHAGLKTGTRVKVHYVESTDIEREGTGRLAGMDAILVPGGFGERGIQGKIEAVRYARENNIPYLGICLGMQVACIEFARNRLGLSDANSTEFNSSTTNPIIALITEWRDLKGDTVKRDERSDLGGTMRLGAQTAQLEQDSEAARTYGATVIRERHRHRFEFNNTYLDPMRAAGLRFSGFSEDGLVEVIELPGHPWFVAVQFHPEFTSTPRDSHPLFVGFVRAARHFSQSRGRSVSAPASAS
jgi:CTP synthase